jgi:outer membrane receptor protein involved in Fe transport
VWEIALEADVPLLKDVPLVQSLNVNLAGRYTDYSTSGSVETWKVGIDYHVNDTVRFRGTTSVDIRAPNLYELYQPQSTGSVGYQDLHTGYNGNTLNTTGGNPDLTPEVARTYSAGIVLTPEFLPGFNASFDWYRIRLHNAITSVKGKDFTTQQLCESSGGTSIYCSMYVRGYPFSNRTPGEYPVGNYPTMIYERVLNSALSEIEGFDFEANYAFSWYGEWTARFLANYQPVDQTQAWPGAPLKPNQVLPNFDVLAKTHLTGFLTYVVDGWTIGLQDRLIGGHNKGPVVSAVPHVNSSNYLDFNLSKDFTAFGADLTGYFNIQNVFDHRGDIYSNSAVQGIYYPVSPEDDVMGRYFTLGLRMKM